MNDDNIVQFPNLMKDAINEDQWREFQGEFYLDCYFAYNGKAAENPEELGKWLKQTGLFASMDNAFFRGWLVRRLSEADQQS